MFNTFYTCAVRLFILIFKIKLKPKRQKFNLVKEIEEKERIQNALTGNESRKFAKDRSINSQGDQ